MAAVTMVTVVMVNVAMVMFLSPQNHVHVIGLKEYVVTDIEEVTRVIFVGNSKSLIL